MTLLEFQLDENEISSARARTVESATADMLRLSFFRMPVRFRIGGVDLLRWRNPESGEVHDWMTVPVVDVAISFLYSVKEAWLYGISYDDPAEVGLGSLTFERSGTKIMVHSRFSGQSGDAEYEALSQLCLRFSLGVRSSLMRAFPALANHPELGAWFRQEIDLPEDISS